MPVSARILLIFQNNIMEDIIKNPLFSSAEEICNHTVGCTKSKKNKKITSTERDLVLNKQDILNCIQFETSSFLFPTPVINRVEIGDLPELALPFSKALNGSNHDIVLVFYEPDINFTRVIHNPKRYVEPLRKFAYVVGPDYSQKIGMNPFVCYYNSWWNKALTAYFQVQGIRVIPNVTWSSPASYSYAFIGIPKNSVIAINCTGIIGNPASMYLWRKGYEEAIKVLEPTMIIRYGDKMPGEYEEISVYYENINLKNLRNHGR